MGSRLAGAIILVVLTLCAPAGAHELQLESRPTGERHASLPPSSDVDALWTTDAGLVLQWPRGTFGDRAVVVDVDYVEDSAVAPLPASFVAVGGPYRVLIDPVERVDVALRVVAPAAAIFHSDDGRSWTRLDVLDSGGERISASLPRNGFVVAAAVVEVEMHAPWFRGPLISVAALAIAVTGREALKTTRRRGGVRRRA